MLTTLYNFCSEAACADGENPYSALLQGTNGDFYGTTIQGGMYNYGTIFKLSAGLTPFVKTHPASGTAEAVVDILGTDLTGTSSVTLNGTPAVFQVVSSSAITTNVPAAASSGKVQVVTPGGTLSSGVPFRVGKRSCCGQFSPYATIQIVQNIGPGGRPVLFSRPLAPRRIDGP